MIPIEDFKNILLKNGVTNLSDEQIIKLRDQQDQMAEIFYSMWLKDRKKKLRANEVKLP